MATLALVNPRRRRKTAKRRTTKARVRRNPSRRKALAIAPAPRKRRRASRPKARRIRRNPIRARKSSGDIMSQIKPAFTAGLGALGLDLAWGFLPIPAGLQTGPLRHVAKGAGALALGYVANMVTDKATARQMAVGALTVVMHNMMRELAQQVMPTVNLGYYNAGFNAGMGEYTSGMGAYISGDTSPYLSAPLSSPFQGGAQVPGQMPITACIDSGKKGMAGMGEEGWFSYN
jgi:hypothetical protein